MCLLFSLAWFGLVHSFILFLRFAHDARSSFCIRFHISNLSFYLCNFVSVLLLLLCFVSFFTSFHSFASLRAYPVANNVRSHTHIHTSTCTCLPHNTWNGFEVVRLRFIHIQKEKQLAVTHDVLHWVDVCFCVCGVCLISLCLFSPISLSSQVFTRFFPIFFSFSLLILPKQQNCNNKNKENAKCIGGKRRTKCKCE